jgi:glutathione S-transferase/GST-like protein
VTIHAWSGVEIDDLPHLKRWVEKIWERPAAQRGRKVPEVPDAPDREEAARQAGSKILA